MLEQTKSAEDPAVRTARRRTRPTPIRISRHAVTRQRPLGARFAGENSGTSRPAYAKAALSSVGPDSCLSSITSDSTGPAPLSAPLDAQARRRKASRRLCSDGLGVSDERRGRGEVRILPLLRNSAFPYESVQCFCRESQKPTTPLTYASPTVPCTKPTRLFRRSSCPNKASPILTVS